MRAGKTIGSLDEVMKDLKKDIGSSQDDVLFIIRVKRNEIGKVELALRKVGLTKKMSYLRPIMDRKI